MSKIKCKIKKNDIVYVIKGKKEDKGKIAKVLAVFPKEQKVIVEGINYVKKATRPNPQKGDQGGIQKREAPMHISKIMLYCEHCHKPARIKMKITSDQKSRTCARCNTSLERK